jgi:hypothetical protein
MSEKVRIPKMAYSLVQMPQVSSRIMKLAIHSFSAAGGRQRLSDRFASARNTRSDLGSKLSGNSAQERGNTDVR